MTPLFTVDMITQGHAKWCVEDTPGVVPTKNSCLLGSRSMWERFPDPFLSTEENIFSTLLELKIDVQLQLFNFYNY